MSELNKAGPETPLGIIASVLTVPRAELDRLGFEGKDPREIQDELLAAEKHIEQMVLRKHLPDVLLPGDLVRLIQDSPESQYVLIHRPKPKPETVRQLTIVQAINALMRATGNINHFSKEPVDVEHLQKTLREVSAFWPGYGSVMAESRINLLLAGQVIKDYFPNIVTGFPGLGQRATDLIKRMLVQLDGVDSNGDIPERVRGTYTTQTFWLEAIRKAEEAQAMWHEMYNIEVERKKNPGKVRVGKQWMEYGSVFFDGNQTEMVVINHQTLPKQTLELKAQGFENTLAQMPREFAQPAIDVVNSLGGNMFAAVCRAGMTRIAHEVSVCQEAFDASKTGKTVDGSGIEVIEQ